MKKNVFTLVLLILLLFAVSPSYSQDTAPEKEYNFTIKTNPLSALGGPFWVVVVPVTGEYKVLFEAAVSEKSSVQLGVGYLGPSILLNLDDLTSDEDNGEISGLNTSGYRVQGMYKFFISRDLQAPEGFYIGPHVSYAAAKIASKDNADDNIEATKLNLNAVFGYQLITSGGFTLDLYTGMGFVSRKWEFSGADSDFDADEFKDKASVSIPLGFTFGYAF